MSVFSQSSSRMVATKTDEDFLETMQKFPAVYDKSKKNHSNRDIVNNGWKSIAQEMNISIDEAKKWWAQLTREYRNERNKQDIETRSGSGAVVKREQFSLYYAMKEMLMNTVATGCSYSNYMTSSDKITQQQNLSRESPLQEPSNAVPEGYNFKKFSGRPGRKALELKEAVDNINLTLANGFKILEDSKQTFDLNSANEIIGSIIQSQLEQMDSQERRKKIKEIHKILSNHESLNGSASSENDD